MSSEIVWSRDAVWVVSVHCADYANSRLDTNSDEGLFAGFGEPGRRGEGRSMFAMIWRFGRSYAKCRK